MIKKIIWIVVETPLSANDDYGPGDFFIHGPYASLEDSNRTSIELTGRYKEVCLDWIPLDVTNLNIMDIE